MREVWAICRRDVRAAFASPLMWLVLAAWLALIDLVFWLGISEIYGRPAPAGVPLFVNAQLVGIHVLALLAPALTMNSFALERSQGTMQLLMTVPIREHQLVVGKYLAALACLCALVAATLVQPLVLVFISHVPLPQLACGTLGLVLICSLFAALGVWISLLVDSAVSAYVITFAAIAVLFILGWGDPAGPLGGLGQALGMSTRAGPFLDGEPAPGRHHVFPLRHRAVPRRGPQRAPGAARPWLSPRIPPAIPPPRRRRAAGARAAWAPSAGSAGAPCSRSRWRSRWSRPPTPAASASI